MISCKAVFQIGATANRTISARMSFMRALNTMTFHLSNRSCDVIQIANITIHACFFSASAKFLGDSNISRT